MTDLSTCFAVGYSIDQAEAYWQQVSCPAALSLVLNESVSGSLGYNPQSLGAAQSLMSSLLQAYDEGAPSGSGGLASPYDSFFGDIVSTCRADSLPGVCSQFLEGYCAQWSRDDIASNPYTGQLCGCYAPDNPYPAMGGECDPLCSRGTSVQKADPITGKILRCDPKICIIDDTAIEAARSSSTGSINFTNICTGCGSDGCLCIVSGTDPEDLLSELGVAPTVTQFCGKNSRCVTVDSEGNVVSDGPCTDQPMPIAPGRSIPQGSLLWPVLAFIFLALCLLAVWLPTGLVIFLFFAALAFSAIGLTKIVWVTFT